MPENLGTESVVRTLVLTPRVLIRIYSAKIDQYIMKSRRLLKGIILEQQDQMTNNIKRIVESFLCLPRDDKNIKLTILHQVKKLEKTASFLSFYGCYEVSEEKKIKYYNVNHLNPDGRHVLSAQSLIHSFYGNTLSNALVYFYNSPIYTFDHDTSDIIRPQYEEY